MRAFATLMRREFGVYFLSLTGYVIISAVSLLIGISFLLMLRAFNNDTLNAPLTEGFYSVMFFWLILLLAAPLITMRLFAQEKATGTFETLLTTPISELEVVLAKYTAALAFYAVTWLPLLPCLLVVHRYTAPGTPFEWGPTASTGLGILLIGSVFVSLGCLASALTRSQIIAATLSLAFGVSFFLLSFLKYSVTAHSGWLARAAARLSLIEHMEDFARGVVDTRPVVLYLTLTALFLFLTLKAVEARRWR
jgi:ABC-2 type transport system permease protein